jgi:hypothetical protein
MARSEKGGREAMLTLARELRRALSERQEMLESVLDTYDEAVGNRGDHAAALVRAVQAADSAYEARVGEALKAYREDFEKKHRGHE